MTILLKTKRIVGLFIIICLFFSICNIDGLDVAAVKHELDVYEKDLQTFIVYEDKTETTINGIPESQVITPKMLIGDPIFVSYTPGGSYTSYFKLIATTTVDNRQNNEPFNLGLSIEQSSASGSEISTNIALSTEFKIKVIGAIKASVGVGVKETRSTNEAVGASGSMVVPAGKRGKIEAYYGGVTSGGQLTYKRICTSSTSGYQYFTTVMGAHVHTDWFDLNFKPTFW